jgi:hypothetical protein
MWAIDLPITRSDSHGPAPNPLLTPLGEKPPTFSFGFFLSQKSRRLAPPRNANHVSGGGSSRKTGMLVKDRSA